MNALVRLKSADETPPAEENRRGMGTDHNNENNEIEEENMERPPQEVYPKSNRIASLLDEKRRLPDLQSSSLRQHIRIDPISTELKNRIRPGDPISQEDSLSSDPESSDHLNNENDKNNQKKIHRPSTDDDDLMIRSSSDRQHLSPIVKHRYEDTERLSNDDDHRYQKIHPVEPERNNKLNKLTARQISEGICE